MRDDELDAVLSALTSVDPDPGLASRVVRAIVAPREPRRVMRRVAPLATAAVVLLAAGVVWRASERVPAPEVTSAPAMAIGRAIEPAASGDHMWGRASGLPSDPPSGASVASGASMRPSPHRTARVTTRDEEPWPNRLPALERSAPLAIHRIEREVLDDPRLAVEPLSISQLEIESLER